MLKLFKCSLTLPDEIVEADGVPDDCALRVARLVFDCIAINKDTPIHALTTTHSENYSENGRFRR